MTLIASSTWGDDQGAVNINSSALLALTHTFTASKQDIRVRVMVNGAATSKTLTVRCELSGDIIGSATEPQGIASAIVDGDKQALALPGTSGLSVVNRNIGPVTVGQVLKVYVQSSSASDANTYGGVRVDDVGIIGIGGSLAVTLTCSNGSSGVAGAIVTVRNSADTSTLAVLVADANGQVTLDPESGVAYKLRVTAPQRCTWANPISKTYTESGTDTVTGTPVSITAPSDPAQSTAYVACGSPTTVAVGATITLVRPPDAVGGVALPKIAIPLLAAGSPPDRIEAAVYRAALYRVRVPSLGIDGTVTIPDASTADLIDLLDIT